MRYILIALSVCWAIDAAAQQTCTRIGRDTICDSPAGVTILSPTGRGSGIISGPSLSLDFYSTVGNATILTGDRSDSWREDSRPRSSSESLDRRRSDTRRDRMPGTDWFPLLDK